MSLATATPVAFIPTQNAEAARTFYEQTLGLHFESDNGFALIFRAGPQSGSDAGLMLRVFRTQDFTPATHTVFGWFVDNLEATMDTLAAKEISFLRYSYFPQDERGIWQAPDGGRIAWFHDPDDNVLSLSQKP